MTTTSTGGLPETLQRPHGSSVGYARPLFGLLPNAPSCTSPDHARCLDWSADAMRVLPVHYEDGRRFL